MIKEHKLIPILTKELADIGEIGYSEFYNMIAIIKESHILGGLKWFKYNLYAVSDEEIKYNEWCFEIHNGSSKAPSSTLRYADTYGNIWWLRQLNMDYSNTSTTFHKIMDGSCKKIIATTDHLIYPVGNKLKIKAFLKVPTISENFIKYYIDQYNNEIKIDRINIEYDLNLDGKNAVDRSYYVPIVTDNIVNATPVKTSWNRAEVVSISNESYLKGIKDIGLDKHNEWMKTHI